MKRVLLIVLVAGCLEVPKPAGQECLVNSDCNTVAGEVCDEGLCYGNPPAGAFAATLSAPATREDLISTEIPLLSLPADGWLGDLGLEAPVTISGRVEAACPPAQTNCPQVSIAADVRITRPSRFPGGPTLRLSAQSNAGLPRGTDSFSIRIPRTHENDLPYLITIDPQGGGDLPPPHGGKDPAELVPPRRLTFFAYEDLEHQTYVLGGADQAVISGTLKDPLGGYLTSYRVVALGRWDTSSAKTQVSTVDYTTTGQYSITLSDDIVGPVELVAKSYDPNVVAPELHVTGLSPITQQKNLAQPTGLGSVVDVDIPIKGLAGDGQVKPVSGARVIVNGFIEAAFPGSATIIFSIETITGDDGVARLSLLDGVALAASYRLRVVPPASSPLGVVYGAAIELANPKAVQLPSRVALRGTVVDFTGKPLGDVSVTARRSQRFLWSLAAPDQAFLDEIPAATALTPESGDFVVWVDPSIADAWAHYDLTFQTPMGSTAPNWSIRDLEIPRLASQMTVALDMVTIPDAAYLHGRIVDPAGLPVDSSALRIFQLPSDNLLCSQVGYAPDGCNVDALALGQGESDETGTVRLALPRP